MPALPLVRFLIALAVAGGASSAGAAPVLRAIHPVPDRWLVVLDPSVASADVPALAGALARRHGGEIERVFRHAVRGFSVRLPAAAVEALAREPGVRLVEEDAEVRTAALQTSPPWNLDRLDQRTLPLDFSYAFDSSGSGVQAFVIDTGIRAAHAEFGGRVLPGFDAVGDGRGSADCNGHGTHVAATLGGATFGVAKDVTLHAVRVLGCDGTGTVSGVVAGIDWVTAQELLPAIATLSLVAAPSPALDAALEGSIAAGVSYAVAAGNDGGDACSLSPARVPAALTVGASTADDRVEPSSNQGSCVDLFAPGQDVRSAWWTSDTATALLSGTSMATPHVAGVAARLLEGAPSASPAAVAEAIAAGATAGALVGLSGGPDRLLYSSLAPLPVADETPPSCAITWPSTGASLARAVVAVRADASDAGGVERVDLYVSGRLVASDGAAPYELLWDARAWKRGRYELRAHAFDSSGNATASEPVAVRLR
jgi:subtilisin family serine protease